METIKKNSITNAGNKVLSIGELVVEFFSKNSDQKFDETGKEYLGPFPSGAPAIFIDTIGKLGLDCGFIGTVGDDDFGKLIVGKLNKDSVDTSKIKIIKNISTGLAFVRYFNGGSREFLYYIKECAPGKFNEEMLDEEYVSQFNYLHISGNVLLFSNSTKNACYKACEIIKKNNGKITFDPNMRLEILSGESLREINDIFFYILEKSFIFFPSKGEIELLSGISSEKKAVEYFFDKTQLKYIVIKKGSEGSAIYTRDNSINVATDDENLIKRDPTGAGDCYCGAFLYGIINGWELYKVGDFANQIGRETVSVFGPMEGSFVDILKKFN